MTPFSDRKEDCICSIGETELIRRIKTWLGDANPPPPSGIGDDCAVIELHPNSGPLLVTTDPVIYGKHFDDSLTPAQVAQKLANRNLSDLAAMGGAPTFATISLALDPKVSIHWLQEFYLSLAENALRNSYFVVGGDISSADGFLGAFFTANGHPSAGATAILRGKAKPGSAIMVTGSLGGTRLRKHYAFAPRLPQGQWLAQRANDVLSCTDLSDGIGKDFTNLLPLGTNLELDCERLPLSDDARIQSANTGKSPIDHALNDGEDFELMFALSPEADLGAFASDWHLAFPKLPLSQVGRVVEGKSPEAASKLLLQNAPVELKASGFEHLHDS